MPESSRACDSLTHLPTHLPSIHLLSMSIHSCPSIHPSHVHVHPCIHLPTHSPSIHLLSIHPPTHLSSIHLLTYVFSLAMLIPQPGVKPMPPVVEAWRPNPWTARKVPPRTCLLSTHPPTYPLHLFVHPSSQPPIFH